MCVCVCYVLDVKTSGGYIYIYNMCGVCLLTLTLIESS